MRAAVLQLVVVAAAAACVDDPSVTLQCARFDGDDSYAAWGQGLAAAFDTDGAARVFVRSITLVRDELTAADVDSAPTGVHPDAWAAMFDKTDSSYDVDIVRLDVGSDAVLAVPAIDIPRAAASDDPAWDRFHEDYGQAAFVLLMSPVGYSCDDDAVFVAIAECGTGCARTRAVSLRFVEDAWLVVATQAP